MACTTSFHFTETIRFSTARRHMCLTCTKATFHIIQTHRLSDECILFGYNLYIQWEIGRCSSLIFFFASLFVCNMKLQGINVRINEYMPLSYDSKCLVFSLNALWCMCGYVQ